MALPFFACENEIEFNGDEMQSMMVVNGFLSPDSIVKVHVTKSKFFLQDDSGFDNVNNANVQLWVNNELKGVLTNAGNGYYTFNYTPKTGDKIKITASAGGLDDVYAETEIPRAVPILAVDTFSIPQSDQYYTSGTYTEYGGYDIDTLGVYHSIKLNVKLTFKDSLNFNNYYVLNAQIKQTLKDGSTRFALSGFYSEDLVFGGASVNNDVLDTEAVNQYYEFNDDLINGSTYKLSLYSFITNHEDFNKPDDGGVDTNPVIKNELIVSLISVSRSYYLYLKSMDALSNSSDFLSEPVQVHSNIVGGIGILGGYNVYSRIISLPPGYKINGYYY